MTEPSDQPSTARTVTVSFDLARLPSVVTALGVALVSTAVVLSAYYSRQSGELDGSTYLMGLLASAGLLAVAGGSHLLVADAERRASLVSWPGAAGTVGAGLMLAIWVDGDPWAAYGAGALILVVSVLAYAGTQAAPFVLSAIIGLGLLYIQGFGDVIDVEGDDGTSMVTVGAGILFFVGAVTTLGWLLPKTRVLSAVVVGIGAIVAITGAFQAVFLFSALSSIGGEVSYSGTYEQLEGTSLSEDFPDEYSDDEFAIPELTYDEEGSSNENPYSDDVKILLAYSAALALFWSLCAVATGHVAFRIMSVTILVISIPVTAVALVVSHPTWWQVALTGGGGLLLALVGLRLLRTDTPPPAATA